MESALENFVEAVTRSSSKISIWRTTYKFAENLGFSDCSLITANGGQHLFKTPRTITSYSSEFKKAYECEGMGEIDPFLHFHCHDMRTKQITSKKLSSFPKASTAHRLFLDHVAENGGTGGISIPVRTIDQPIFGGWIMSCAESDNRINMLYREHARILQLASVLAYERMVALGLLKNGGELLSARERECLLWLSAGLRVQMIAEKLSISESAVNLYITNAKQKLGAKTREQAVARAIINGQINL